MIEDPPTIICPAPQTIQLTAGTSIAATYTATAISGKPPVAIVRQRARYDFVVEAYLRDFRTAARRIHADVMASASPHIPPPD